MVPYTIEEKWIFDERESVRERKTERERERLRVCACVKMGWEFRTHRSSVRQRATHRDRDTQRERQRKRDRKRERDGLSMASISLSEYVVFVLFNKV